jgi:hypothetical protein
VKRNNPLFPLQCARRKNIGLVSARGIATGKVGYFFSRTEDTVIIFYLVLIVKYNNN